MVATVDKELRSYSQVETSHIRDSQGKECLEAERSECVQSEDESLAAFINSEHNIARDYSDHEVVKRTFDHKQPVCSRDEGRLTHVLQC